MLNAERLLAAIDCDHRPCDEKCAGCPYYGRRHANHARTCKTGGIKADLRYAVKALQRTEATNTVFEKEEIRIL